MKKILLASMAATMLTACSDVAESVLDGASSPMQVTASIFTGPSRGMVNGSGFTEAGHTLGVSVFRGDGSAYGTSSTHSVNVPYVSEISTNPGGGVNPLSWASKTPISLSATEGKAVAYYPYSASVTDIHAIPVDVTKSQTDFLYSGWVSGVSATIPQADFTLRHALCAVRVNITDGGYTGAGKVTSVSVASPALATVATLDATDGSFPSFSGQDTPVTSTEGFTIGQDPQSASLLAVPTGEAAGLSIRIAMDGKTFTVPFSSSPVTFLPGKVYTVNLTAKDSESPFEVSGTVGISTDWSTVKLQNPTMDPDVVEEVDRYIVAIEIPTAGFNFYSNVSGFTGIIDWGDGKSEQYDSEVNNPLHVYAKAGTYYVTAKGKCNGLSYKGSFEQSAKTLLDVIYIGKNLGLVNIEYGFYKCANIKRIRKGLLDVFTETTSLASVFEGCSNLVSIPIGLFDNCIKVKNFKYTFYGCKALQSIPAGLFDKCIQGNVDFYGTFCGCSSLQSIPAGLFDNCTKVTSFESTFNGCSGLTSIPAGLFDKCTEVTSFRYMFMWCNGLTSIPAGLFDKCTKVTNFSNTFCGCNSLTSIPAGLFDNCTKVTSFNSTFSRCSSLTSIPVGLFDKCPGVTRFNYTFEMCSSLVSIPAGLFDNCTKVTDFGATFENCSSLISIPAGLFDKCPGVTSFSYTFSGCSGLTTIPQGLFDKCTQVTNFSNTFENCSSLISIPAGLFDKCPGVTSFSYTFYMCKKLSIGITDKLFEKCTKVTDFSYTLAYINLDIIPAGLLDYCPNVTNLSGTFAGWKELTSIPAGLFDKCTKVTNFSKTFSSCHRLRNIPVGLFDNCPNVTTFEGVFHYCNFFLKEIPNNLFDKCTKVTNFNEVFRYCSSLQNIPEGLFDNCPDVTSFKFSFDECSSLQSIPQGLFDKSTKVTDFWGTFDDCNNLNGESPYKVIDGVKIHLYEREKYPQYFSKPTSKGYCFRSCTNLTDYSQIPSSWK